MPVYMDRLLGFLFLAAPFMLLVTALLCLFHSTHLLHRTRPKRRPVTLSRQALAMRRRRRLAAGAAALLLCCAALIFCVDYWSTHPFLRTLVDAGQIIGGTCAVLSLILALATLSHE